MRQAEQSRLSPWQATWDAILNRSIIYFPRVQNKGESSSTLDDKEAIAETVETLIKLNPSDEELDAVLEQARASLDEVKGLTDYQDEKATRLLTIITFLSALSGVLFVRLADTYPWRETLNRRHANLFHSVLLSLTYLVFVIFALLAICGALVTFHAIRARFRYPQAPQPKRAKSFLFYKSIIESLPGEWARSFVNENDPTKIEPGLKLYYFRNYITESYLVASKVADKVRYLEPAQTMQFWAIRLLLFWLVLFAMIFAIIPPGK
jgi:hypothetical protein